VSVLYVADTGDSPHMSSKGVQQRWRPQCL